MKNPPQWQWSNIYCFFNTFNWLCNCHHYLVCGCQKKVKLSITFRYKSLMFTLFFCKNVVSQLSSKKKELLIFKEQMLVLFLENCETKKNFIVLHNKIVDDVAFTKRKKNFWPCLFVFCFLYFGYLEEKTILKKTKQKLCFW